MSAPAQAGRSALRRRSRRPPPPPALPRRVATPVVGAAEATRAVLAHRRHRRAATDRRTLALGVVALLTSGAVAAGEVVRVWRRGSAPLPAETADVLGAAEEAARQTVEVAVSGYRAGSRRETALLGMLASFTVSFGAVRATTHVIRSRGRWGPMHNLRLGRRHIHHFVPGIALAFLAGGASIVSRDEALDPWLAVPFGTGLALTLDESALLLEFDDVYWTEQGVVSVQITLAALGILSALVLVLRALRRGEGRVLLSSSPTPGPTTSSAWPSTPATRSETTPGSGDAA